MDAVKSFSNAGTVAVMRLLDECDRETVKKVDQAMRAGGQLAISLRVDHAGNSMVTLELVQGEHRHPIATITGKTSSVSH